MNIQELEEIQYDPQPELVNAFARSRSEAQLNDSKIDEAIARGKHVLVFCGPYFCPSTDAYIGENHSYVNEYETRESADSICSSLNEDCSCDDVYHIVMSPKGTNEPKRLAQVVESHDEAPF